MIVRNYGPYNPKAAMTSAPIYAAMMGKLFFGLTVFSAAFLIVILSSVVFLPR
jgi:hypothetical protein